MRWIETIWQDLRYGARIGRANPGFTAILVLTLGLGIGVNTAIFNVVNGVLLRPLPYPNPDQLVQIKKEYQRRDGTGRYSSVWLRLDEILAWDRSDQVPVQVASHTWFHANLSQPNQAIRITGACVSGPLLGMLGIKPCLGRDFQPEDQHSDSTPTVILSYACWQGKYGGDPHIVNKTLRLDKAIYTIIGVLPRDFQLTESYDLLVPLACSREYFSQHFGAPRAFGRLQPGVQMTQAERVLDAIFQSVRDAKDKGRIVLIGLQADMAGEYQHQVWVLFGVVVLVLLIATANVANLLLARGVMRQMEITVRSALGADRGRIVRQLLAETLVLAGMGGICALLLCSWCMHLLQPILTDLLTDWYPIGDSGVVAGDIHMDGSGLMFAFLVTLVTGLICGAAPAWQAGRVSLADSIKQGSRTSTASHKQHRLCHALVIAEAALAVILLLGAGLLLKSFAKLRHAGLGFQPDRIMTLTVDLTMPEYPDARSQAAYFKQVLESLRQMPGVEAVSLNSMMPLIQASGQFDDFEIQGRAVESRQQEACDAVVDAAYFKTLGIPLLRGRTFSHEDAAGAPGVVLVSASFCRRYMPDQEPIGRRIKGRYGDEWQTIIGVVGDVRQFDLETDMQPQVYRYYLQSARSLMSVAVKTKANPAQLALPLRDRISLIDKSQAVYRIATLQDRLAQTLARRRAYMLVLALFGGLALVLAGVGIYGVTSYAVSQRTHELGIRMALGANRRTVFALVLKRELRAAVSGVVIGSLSSLGLSRLIASQLYGVPATDPATYLAVALVLVGVAAAACCIPARRATHVDPLTALRSE